MDERELARYASQRRELGEDEIVFDRLAAAEALALARARGTAPAAPGPDSSPPLPDDYDALRRAALACRKCGLAEGRTQVVFSDGNPQGRLLVVGEAPGAHEDRTGLPFVGRAGKLLDLLLASVGLSRADTVYICNVLKCRPPRNRDPNPDEIEACTPYLARQIELVAPEAILAVGGFAAQFVTGRQVALGRLRGEIYEYGGVPAVVTYHPAALLRNRGWTRAVWDDLQMLRGILDRTGRSVGG